MEIHQASSIHGKLEPANSSSSSPSPGPSEGALLHGREPDVDESSDNEHSSVFSTKSLSDLAVEAVYENGRRYCNETYFMPNDEAELTRLSIVHQIYLKLLDGELTKAPIKTDSARILDVGTGPGDWAVAMGEQYPSADIIATDISMFDSNLTGVAPPNVTFELDDAESEWTYGQPFDLVHIRGLSGSFTDWPAVYRQAFKHLKPGGYIEVSEGDPSAGAFQSPNSPDHSYFDIYVSAVRSAAEESGYPRNLDHLKQSMFASAGFVDVHTHEVVMPVGPWPVDLRSKTIGKMVLITILEGLEAYSLRQLSRREGWNLEKVLDLCDQVKEELQDIDGATLPFKFIIARKPVTDDGRGAGPEEPKKKKKKRKKGKGKSKD